MIGLAKKWRAVRIANKTKELTGSAIQLVLMFAQATLADLALRIRTFTAMHFSLETIVQATLADSRCAVRTYTAMSELILPHKYKPCQGHNNNKNA